MDKAYELFKYMDCFKYGGLSKDNKIVALQNEEKVNKKDLFGLYVIQHPDELEKSKVGTCYDESLYAYDRLSNYGYNCKLLFLYKKLHKHVNTHCTVLFNKPNDYTYYIFEHTWIKHKGILGPFTQYSYAVNYLVDKWKEAKASVFLLNQDVDVKSILSKDTITSNDFFNTITNITPY